MTAATGTARPGVGGYLDSGFSEATWRFGVQWTAVVAAALAGFAVTLILTALGTAIGLTAGAAAAGVEGEAVGAGALVWWALSVVAAGIVAGRVLGGTVRQEITYHRVLYATLAWVVGVIILLFLLASGVGNIIGGLGGGLGAASATNDMPALTRADSTQVAQTAAAVSSGAAWGLFLSMLLGLGATIMAAGRPAPEPAKRI